MNREKSADAAGIPYSGHQILESLEDAKLYQRFLLQQMQGFFGPPGALQLLDFGAGRGLFSKAMRSAGYSVDCLEPDPELHGHLTEQRFSVAMTQGQLADGGYDGVYSLNVLEHIPDDLEALAAMRRALKPDGRLFLYVPAFEQLFGPLDHAVGHLRRYRKDPLAALVHKAGFRVLHAVYADSLGYPVTLAHNLVSRGRVRLSPAAVRFYDRILFPLSRRLDPLCGGIGGKNLLITAQVA